MQGIYEDRRKLADSLLSQLQALGLGVDDADLAQGPTSAEGRVHPKFRSLKDPSKTWAGRGKIAGWLEEEMRETGRPKEHFLIANQIRQARSR